MSALTSWWLFPEDGKALIFLDLLATSGTKSHLPSLQSVGCSITAHPGLSPFFSGPFPHCDTFAGVLELLSEDFILLSLRGLFLGVSSHGAKHQVHVNYPPE